MPEDKDRINISVRSLVEFIFRSGDIDARHRSGKADAMQEGGRIHRMLQKREGPDYHAEVPLRHVISYENYDLCIEGRADGIYGVDREGETVTVDEIKAVFRELKRIKEPETVHLSQAKCYAYIYALQNELDEINVRMTYCNMESEDVRYFHFGFTFGELRSWFENVINEYRRWADFSYEWRLKRNLSIKSLVFPFSYRQGQKELAEGVYRTIFHEKRLFLNAPTGTGKTLAVLFPAIKAMGEGLTERIFYATAKTVTATVASESFEELRKQDFFFKTVTLTAKEKVCLSLDQDQMPSCNPVDCPYAKGHYDRINDALYDFLTREDDHSRKRLLEFAEERKVCPFELSLDISLFCDAVILDYNYCFDPRVKLKRFFAEGINGNYIFLVDEAHNLIDRAREMFSAELYKEDFLKVRAKLMENWTALADTHPSTKEELKREEQREKVLKLMKRLSTSLSNCSKALVPIKKLCDSKEIPAVREPEIEDFASILNRAAVLFGELTEESSHAEISLDNEVLELYFNIRAFLETYETEDECYVNYGEIDGKGRLKIRLFNVNPSKELRKCTDRARSSIFFSATLLPVTYYMDLISGDRNDYTIYASSSFDNSKRGIFISRDVSSKYTRRSDSEYQRIAAEIFEITSVRKGNYMVFFPSYAFLREVTERYLNSFEDPGQEILIQEKYMDEESRERFLDHFENSDRLLAFCVSGGIFAEGIDLKEERLIGAVIVGTALPQVSYERSLLKEYFEEHELDGFDYAYRYPGMNKVLQAAGRVIRTESDVGIVALLDERFLTRGYSRLFPREWVDLREIELSTAAEEVGLFWDDQE